MIKVPSDFRSLTQYETETETKKGGLRYHRIDVFDIPVKNPFSAEKDSISRDGEKKTTRRGMASNLTL